MSKTWGEISKEIDSIYENLDYVATPDMVPHIVNRLRVKHQTALYYINKCREADRANDIHV